MRTRTILMILFAALVAVFVALNWTELSRPTPLNMGISQVEGPLGLVMLGLLLIAAVLFSGYAIAIQTGALMQARENNKELKAQRELAENAEASRFTELRGLIDKIESDSQTRQSELRGWFEQRLSTLQQDVNNKVEASGNTLAAFMGELDDRMQRHLGMPATAEPVVSRHVPALHADGQMADTAPSATPAPAAAPGMPASAGASITNFARRLFSGDKSASSTEASRQDPPPLA